MKYAGISSRLSYRTRFCANTGWYVMPRPEGKRVLLIAANGETVARQMSGAITHR